MNLQIDKKQAVSPLPSEKTLVALAGDLYAQLRDLGLRPRDVISIASHLLSNVMTTIRREQQPQTAAESTH